MSRGGHGMRKIGSGGGPHHFREQAQRAEAKGEKGTPGPGCRSVQRPDLRMKARSLNLETVHAVETAFLKGSETICQSLLCQVRFEQTGLKMSPKHFCCDECKQQASLIRRVAKIYGLSVEAVHKVLMEAVKGVTG